MILDKIKANIDIFCVVGGNKQYVMLFNDHNLTFTREFINDCLTELGAIPFKVELGNIPSNLEKLAFEIIKKGTFTE